MIKIRLKDWYGGHYSQLVYFYEMIIVSVLIGLLILTLMTILIAI